MRSVVDRADAFVQGNGNGRRIDGPVPGAGGALVPALFAAVGLVEQERRRPSASAALPRQGFRPPGNISPEA